jgi:hypothetical protein
MQVPFCSLILSRFDGVYESKLSLFYQNGAGSPKLFLLGKSDIAGKPECLIELERVLRRERGRKDTREGVYQQYPSSEETFNLSFHTISPKTDHISSSPVLSYTRFDLSLHPSPGNKEEAIDKASPHWIYFYLELVFY